MLDQAVQIETLLGVAIGACGIFWGLYVYRRQVNAQLFLAYTDRYKQVMGKLSGDSREFRLAVEGEPPDESRELTAAALEYLNRIVSRRLHSILAHQVTNFRFSGPVLCVGIANRTEFLFNLNIELSVRLRNPEIAGTVGRQLRWLIVGDDGAPRN